MRKRNTALLHPVRTRVFILLLLLSGLVLSCSKEDKDKELNNDPIIGTWYFNGGKEYFQPDGGTKTLTDTDEPDPSETLQFKSDGTVTYKYGEEQEAGQYKLTGDRLHVKYNNAEMGEADGTVLELNSTTLKIEFRETGLTNEDDVSGTYFYEQTFKKK